MGRRSRLTNELWGIFVEQHIELLHPVTPSNKQIYKYDPAVTKKDALKKKILLLLVICFWFCPKYSQQKFNNIYLYEMYIQ